MYVGTYLASIYVCPSVPYASYVSHVHCRRRRRRRASSPPPPSKHGPMLSSILHPFYYHIYCKLQVSHKKKSEAMWYFYLALGLISFWWFLLRPRTGGKSAPPCVTSSKIVPIPLVGVITEFLKSPNDMMKRCYDDFGSVFTIPVSIILAFVAL